MNVNSLSVNLNLNRVTKIDDEVSVKNALVSLADKRCLAALAAGLAEACPGLTVYSTGGTYEALKGLIAEDSLSLNLRQVSAYTGQPEMQGGLVKTLDYKIYLGLLSETHNPAHAADLARTGAAAFDLVVVNLYPFREASAAMGASLEDARTHIDIGGPCMLRAAAKNFLRVAVLSSPGEYETFLRELKRNSGKTSLETRFRLAQKAFRLTAEYDAVVADYLGSLSYKKALACYSPQDSGADKQTQ